MVLPMRNLVTISIVSILLCPDIGGVHRKKIVRTIKVEQTPVNFPYEPAITIWIHGTQLINRKESRATVNNYKGLKPINCLTPLEPFLEAFIHIDTDNPDNIHKMYTFLWSGKLSFKSRLKASVILYHQLLHLKEEYYRRCGVYPKIRIITHSHGGNVALNLARVYPKVGVKLVVDELILLACPVQRETACFIEHGMFNAVYALYSKLDFIQVIDPQGFYDGNIFHIFSRRRFDWHTKLRQAEVRVNNKRLMHTAFQKASFLHLVPALTADLDEWRTLPENTPEARLRLCVMRDQANSSS